MGFTAEIVHQELLQKKELMAWKDVLLVKQEVWLMLARAPATLVRLDIMQWELSIVLLVLLECTQVKVLRIAPHALKEVRIGTQDLRVARSVMKGPIHFMGSSVITAQEEHILNKELKISMIVCSALVGLSQILAQDLAELVMQALTP